MGLSLSVRPIISYSSLGAKLEVLLLWTAGFFLRRYSYRGIGTISRYLGKSPFNIENRVVVHLFGRSRLNIRLADYYWSRLLFSDFVYEPDVARVLASCLTPKCAFLDLGANVGYWSVFASEIIVHPDRILAVEASNATFEHLASNAAINGSSFTIIQAAVMEQAGKAVPFVNEGGHAGARVAGELEQFDGHPQLETVETTSIDVLAKRLRLEDTDHILIKLDVEGAEVAALRGAAATLRRRNVLLIYEDHGSDSECTVSRYVIEELGFDVYVANDYGPAKRVSLEDISASKTNSQTGYNFVAVPPGTVIELDCI